MALCTWQMVEHLYNTHINDTASRIATVFDKLNRLIKNY